MATVKLPLAMAIVLRQSEGILHSDTMDGMVEQIEESYINVPELSEESDSDVCYEETALTDSIVLEVQDGKEIERIRQYLFSRIVPVYE